MAESFIHTLADALSTSICAGTRICQFVVVLADAKVGQDCNICSHCLIENDFVIGDRVTVKSGAQLWDGLRVGDDVFIGPNVTFTNGKFPRCKAAPMHYPKTVVNAGASGVGGGGILLGITIGVQSIVGGGAIVTQSVLDDAIVMGNTVRIVGNVGCEHEPAYPSNRYCIGGG